LEDTFKE